MTAVRIALHRDRCIGAGQCVMIAPAVFTQDDEALVAFVEGGEHNADDPRVREVPHACPVQAVEVHED